MCYHKNKNVMQYLIFMLKVVFVSQARRSCMTKGVAIIIIAKIYSIYRPRFNRYIDPVESLQVSCIPLKWCDIYPVFIFLRR